MSANIYQNSAGSISSCSFPSASQPLTFHRRLPGYAPTSLVNAPLLADRLGVGKIWIKDETHRLGMPSFKILGTSWALYQALVKRLGTDVEPWNDLQELVSRFAPLRPLTLVTATDGNHGRAVAHLAALFGFEAHVFVPCDMAESRINAIKQEGARVTLVNGTYDDAVKLAATLDGERRLVLSDTSWPGYEMIPQWVIEGYATILQEVDEELARGQQSGPDLVVVQIGVGALAAAVVQHYRRPDVSSHVKIVGIEPISAVCALTSMKAGRLVTLPDPPMSIMAGLNCGTLSLVACSGRAAPRPSRTVFRFGCGSPRAGQPVRPLPGAGFHAYSFTELNSSVRCSWRRGEPTVSWSALTNSRTLFDGLSG